MRPNVELIYVAGCPNVQAAREQLFTALTKLRLTPQWHEWDSAAPDAPRYIKQYGSPTVLVSGKDVLPLSPHSHGNSCRLYQDGGGFLVAPPAEVIMGALRVAHFDSGGHRSWFAMLPALGVAMLPKVACPACWPAYSGLLAAVGLGFLMETTILLPLTLVFLLTAVGTLVFRAQNRRGYGPFVVGVAAAAIVMVAKFHFEANFGMYAGIGLLVAASLWNSWPKRSASRACSACANTDAARTGTTTTTGEENHGRETQGGNI